MGERFIGSFRDLLQEARFDAVEAHAGSVFGLWPDLRLAYFNPWWYRFASENSGEPAISRDWGLGRALQDALPSVLRPFYEALYGEALRQDRQDFRLLRHEYECSSADLFRRFMMTLYPLGKGEGLLVVNSLVVEGPHDPGERKSHPPDLASYVADDGYVRQCANCRRVKSIREPNRWDWVPAWVEKPPLHTSHTFCDVCFAHYYQD
jgi:hypothetical protein